MEQPIETEGESPLLKRQRVFEELFQALPRLGSDEYLAHLESASTADLPPEILVRAYRQLPPKGAAADATLRRLLRWPPGGRPEHLGPMITYARRKSREMRVNDGDLLQDGLTRIWQHLHGKRGKLGERSWHAFCRREVIDAWRERYGRRGERFPKEEPVEASGDDSIDPFESCLDAPPWHASVEPNDLEKIERVAEQVIGTIPNEFIRQVARETWFKNQRPKVSGNGSGERKPLTSLFPGKSRDQINRALRQADAQLAAALLTDRTITLSTETEAWLRKQGANLRRPSQSAKETKR